MVRDHGNRLINRIDVTGFLAIMVVLLVLVMSPSFMWYDLPTWGADLPKATSATPQRSAIREDSIQVWVERDGTVLFGNTIAPGAFPNKLPSRLLSASIAEEVRKGAPRKIYIRADRHARYGTVREVLQQIQLAGLTDVSFLAEKPLLSHSGRQ